MNDLKTIQEILMAANRMRKSNGFSLSDFMIIDNHYNHPNILIDHIVYISLYGILSTKNPFRTNKYDDFSIIKSIDILNTIQTLKTMINVSGNSTNLDFKNNKNNFDQMLDFFNEDFSEDNIILYKLQIGNI